MPPSRARAEGDLNRLYLIVGGAIVVVLFAALIVPLFVNWDSYTANFEREAARLVGHPVHVGGAAHVRILPSPSVTFTDVEVGEPGADPIVTVETFSATIELMSLLQGEVRVVSMTLDRPHLRLTADELARVRWLQPPPEGSRADKVVLADVKVNDGTLNYVDAQTGVALAFGGVTASIAADSLAGPWRLEGTYVEGERSVPFRFATGRQLEDGTIRLQSDLTLVPLSAKVNADGVLASRPLQGFTYTGNYAVAELAGEKAAPAGWRSQGTFALSPDRIAIDKAVLSNGPAERPTSVAGSATLSFGKQAAFTAKVEARQIDLDRALAGGPGQPVNVAETAQAFIDRIAAWPPLPIPGRISVSVPGIVVGGSVVQDASLTADVSPDGWKLSGVRAQLPGQALVEADGVLSFRKGVSFAGHARLAAAQPGAFASWWRGGANAGAGLLPSFDVAGDVTLAPGRIDLDKVAARIGDASISGRVSWGMVKNGHALSTDLKADRLNTADLKALADLIAGRELTSATAIADSFSVRLAADAIDIDAVKMKGVSVDASYADDSLNIVQLAAADIGGASFRVTGGRIDALTTNPKGHLDGRFEAQTFDSLTEIAAKLLPGSGVSEWLARTAPVLSPAVVNARLNAPPKNGSGFQVSFDGVAGDTTFNIAVQSAVNLKDVAAWRATPSVFQVKLDSPDSAAFARQFGLATTDVDADPGAHVSIKGNGIPKDGLDSAADIEVAGLVANAQGKLVLAGAVPAFNGSATIRSDDLAPLLAVAGLKIPLAEGATPLALTGTATTNGASLALRWQDGTVADRAVSGEAQLARLDDRTWRVGGDLIVDDVDLGWLSSLALGVAPAISDDPKSPWSKVGFTPPTYGAVNGKIGVTTQHLRVGGLDVTGGKVALALQPNRLDVDLTGGSLAGGKAVGGVSIQNVDGGATLTGQFSLAGARVGDFAWRQGDQPVLTGGLDLSANFEATGRSPAALVASTTGGGVIAIHDGTAHNLNPATGQVVVRLSDLGEPFSEAGLKSAVADQIDRQAFAFGETGGAFTIAGGTVRASGLAARAAGADVAGTVAIDLSALSLASDWTLKFSTLEPVAGSGDPQIGVAFRGPLSAPARAIDALPLNSYLSTRQAARMLDVIATEEADRIERQRLEQRLAKMRDDAARIERARQQAIEAAKRRADASAAAAAKVATLHVDREIVADVRSAAQLARSAELAAAAAAAAKSDADAAVAAAIVARAKAGDAQSALAAAIQEDTRAAAGVVKASDDVSAAEAKAASTAQAAIDATNAAAVADDTVKAAAAAEAKAKAEADKAAAATSQTNAALDDANSKAAAARAAADAAATDSANAQAALDAAGKSISEASQAREAAVAALRAAESALAVAVTGAQRSSETARQAAQAAVEADAERARLEMTARGAADDLRRAEAERDNARAEAMSDRQQYSSALAELNAAEAADPAGSGIQVLTKRSMTDHLKQVLEIAENKLTAAENAVVVASGKAASTRAEADIAVGKAQAAAAVAQQAATDNAAVQSGLALKQSQRDAAASDAQAREADAQRAGTAFNAAETDAQQKAQRALDLAALAASAETAQSQATKASAASTAGVEGFALEQARAKHAAAVADAAKARALADSTALEASAASQALTLLRAAYEDASRAAAAAHATRLALEQAAATAGAAAASAQSAADAATARASRLAADAAAAAQRVRTDVAKETSVAPAPPVPRQRPKPFSLVPDAFAGEAPLQITPAQ